MLLRNSRNIIGDGGEHSLREVELHRQRRTDAILSVPRIGVRIVYGAVGQNDLILQVCRQAIRRDRQVGTETAVSSRFWGVKDKAGVIDLLVGVSVGRRALRSNREATQLMMRQELRAQPGTLHVHGTAMKNVEGTAGHAQGRQGSILLITLSYVLRWGVLGGCFLRRRLLLACLLRVHRGGGRRLSRHRRQSQQRRQAQNQGSTNSFSVRTARRLKERGHHYPI